MCDAEAAEVPYTAVAATPDRITARLVVRRVRDARYPEALFPVWRARRRDSGVGYDRRPM